MTLREFYVQRQQAELPLFLKALKALPRDQLSYKPHDRSPSAEQLVWRLTSNLQACLGAVIEKKFERKALPPPPLDEMLRLFERWSNELTDRVSKMDEASWNHTAQFYYGGKLASEQPVGTFLWFVLFDAIPYSRMLVSPSAVASQ